LIYDLRKYYLKTAGEFAVFILHLLTANIFLQNKIRKMERRFRHSIFIKQLA